MRQSLEGTKNEVEIREWKFKVDMIASFVKSCTVGFVSRVIGEGVSGIVFRICKERSEGIGDVDKGAVMDIDDVYEEVDTGGEPEEEILVRSTICIQRKVVFYQQRKRRLIFIRELKQKMNLALNFADIMLIPRRNILLLRWIDYVFLKNKYRNFEGMLKTRKLKNLFKNWVDLLQKIRINEQNQRILKEKTINVWGNLSFSKFNEIKKNEKTYAYVKLMKKFLREKILKTRKKKLVARNKIVFFIRSYLNRNNLKIMRQKAYLMNENYRCVFMYL